MSGRKFKPSQPPGAAGGRRHLPDHVQRRQRGRAEDRRVQGSLARTRAEQDALDALILSQQAEADRIDAEHVAAKEREAAATHAAREQQAAEIEQMEADLAAQRRNEWTLGQARDLIRQGYSVAGTVNRTGWPAEMLDDVQMGEW